MQQGLPHLNQNLIQQSPLHLNQNQQRLSRSQNQVIMPFKILKFIQLLLQLDDLVSHFLSFSYLVPCKDKVPNNYNKKNGCPSRYCAHFAKMNRCKKIWNDVVGTNCRKKISHRWQPVKALCKKSCNACGKSISSFRRTVNDLISVNNTIRLNLSFFHNSIMIPDRYSCPYWSTFRRGCKLTSWKPYVYWS